MHRRRWRPVAASISSLALLMSMMGTTLAVDPSTFSGSGLSVEPDGGPIQGAKTRSGALAQTDPALLGRNDATPVPVLIKLDYDAVASYAGGIEGLAPTSPEVTGKPIRANTVAVDAYRKHVSKKDAAARDAIEAAVPQSTVLESFDIAYGGVSAIVPANRIAALLNVPGVVAVQADTLNQPLTDASPEFIGATQAWSQLGGSTTAGEGVIVGVLDTGIWPQHPSLADNGIDHPGGTYGCEFGDGTDPLLGDPFTCNDKLIGAYAFTDTNLSINTTLAGEFCNDATGVCSARDANGHGTHTATTAAGSAVEEAVLLGVDRGPISGIAPGAHVIAYRVCLDTGCYGSDSVAAVEQAIVDDVDVLNFSISGGSDAYVDAVELAFLDAYAAGILVNASAGNNGPGAGTANHAGPWTNTVAASTSDRHFLTTLELSADGGANLNITGATVTDGIADPTDVILAQDVPGYSDPLCQTALPADSATGLVVACQRGVIARVDKSKNVEPSGAAGMILYNPVMQGLNTDNHFVPSVHIDQPDSDAFLDFMDANAGVQARWDPGTATAVPGDVMASFSSRGPLGDFLKPDVTAPGVQILAGHTPVPVGEATGVTGQLFQAIAGTSMSSPHSAGVSALVKAAHPDWTPGQIKSALMTSSVQSVLKEDGATPSDPFDRGAGSIRANRAIAPTITFDVNADDYYASSTDPLGRLHLNLPSINANPMPGAISTQRTLTNVSGLKQNIQVSVQAPSGAKITVTPSKFRLDAGASQQIRIVIDGTKLADGQYFGQITLDVKGSGADAVLPVAFNKTQGGVSLEHSCDPTEFPRGTATDCSVTVTNLLPVEAQASLNVSTSAKANKLAIQNVGAPGIPSGNGFNWSGALSPALAPTIDSIEDAGGTSPAGEYLPLSIFGIAPIAGVGDESIVNFNVPAFQYGSEAYTRLAVDSNGYVVIGGGTAEDNDCCAPQDFPDPARPNNVLAPYWTDLNPGTGGAVRIGLLAGGGITWLVVDWEQVDTFGVPDSASSFQVWIQLGATEGIWFTYGALSAPSPDGLTVGAENRDGTSGVTLGTAPTADDYVITTSPPAPGGSVTIPYDAVGSGTGMFEIVATMRSNLL
ncbi:MAG: S8 family serine peptidase, partial [Candidatus Limnocylindria bacterium]